MLDCGWWVHFSGTFGLTVTLLVAVRNGTGVLSRHFGVLDHHPDPM